jgi:hypothetical protein
VDHFSVPFVRLTSSSGGWMSGSCRRELVNLLRHDEAFWRKPLI